MRITSVSPPSSTMLMGRQSPATQTATALVTFSRTGLVIFLEKSWSMGWRSSNLGLLSFGCFALRVWLNSALQMLHTTLVLSIVPSFWLLNRDFPPNIPSALSIFNYRSGYQDFSRILHS